MIGCKFLLVFDSPFTSGSNENNSGSRDALPGAKFLEIQIIMILNTFLALGDVSDEDFLLIFIETIEEKQWIFMLQCWWNDAWW